MALRTRCSEGQCVDVGKVGHIEEYRIRPGGDFGNAKKYARELGLWYMDGLTLATYVTNLGLKDFVMSLADSPIYPGKSSPATTDEEPIVVQESTR